MTPKQQLELYETIAATILNKYSFDRAQSLLTMYGISLEWINNSLPPEPFIVEAFMHNETNKAIQIAKDFEIEIPWESSTQNQSQPFSMSDSSKRRIFISHSSLDADVVGKIIDYLIAMGVNHKNIFCSSFEGYGITVGDNFLEAIRREISSDTLVLFVLSTNFYDSVVSLCEMGAAWVNSKENVPILIPPFDFSDVKGVIPLTQGLKIDDKPKLNNLKSKVERFLSIDPIDSSIWERNRDSIFKSTAPLLKERTKPDAIAAISFKKIWKGLSDDEKAIMEAIFSNDGFPLNMSTLTTGTSYGSNIISNLERQSLVERVDDPDTWDLYHLTLFGLNMMHYLDKMKKAKSRARK